MHDPAVRRIHRLERLRTAATPHFIRSLARQTLETGDPLRTEALAVDADAGASARRGLHRAREQMLDRQQKPAVVLEEQLLILARELDLELGLALENLDVELEPPERRELAGSRQG